MGESSILTAAVALGPFALLILAIAILPAVTAHWWESSRHKLLVTAAIALPVVTVYLRIDPHALAHAGREYASFVILIGALYVIASGIVLEGDLEATPATNLTFLAIGAVLASIVGTTGASVLLIRPLLSTNKERRHVSHTVLFFIFLVSNVGGCLTPLGDPPLYLGYLRGVPFTWTLRLWAEWLFMTAGLLATYYVWDRRLHALEPPERIRLDRSAIKPLHIGGTHNLVLLGLVVGASLLPAPWREVTILIVTAASWFSTSAHIFHANRFSLDPIAEVVILFAGIFATMVPAIEWLARHADQIALSAPWHYFWTAGALSGLLDNTPTYGTFLVLAQAKDLPDEVVGVPHRVLAGISLGAVMMGAYTYVGNAPNMLVRAVAERRGVAMPSFAGYIGYSSCVLLPWLALLSVLFLR